MKAHILCDASFDDAYQMATCAGSVVFNGETHRFTARATDISDPNEAELFAIFASMQKLWKMMVKANLDNGKKVTSLKIFTDSVTAHRQLIPEDYGVDANKRNKKYLRYQTKIESLMGAIGAVPHIKHVKGHKKKSEASPLEAKHNEIDVMARLDLKAYRKEVFSPSIEKSKYYGVNLNAKYNPKKQAVMFKLGYELAESGFVARIHFEGGTLMKDGLANHPFAKGIAYYAQESGLDLAQLIEPIDWNTDFWGISDTKNGCNGLDQVLLRDVLRQEELLKVFDFNSPSANKAGACSRLMFGHQARPKSKCDAPHKYCNKPSRFLVNFGSNKGERRWLSSFAEKTEMPYLNTPGKVKTQMEQLKEKGEIKVAVKKQEQALLMAG